jgi:hypothetical protein
VLNIARAPNLYLTARLGNRFSKNRCFAWQACHQPIVGACPSTRLVLHCLAFRALSGIFDSEKLLRHGLMSIPPRRVYRASTISLVGLQVVNKSMKIRSTQCS